MVKDFNQAIVLGNLTRDPELRHTPNGQAVASFSVATNRSWNDAQGEKKDDVQYHEIVAWGKLAELVDQYLTKGRKVMIVGRLQTRSWEGQDGVKRTRTEIVATDVNFIDRPKDGATKATSETADEKETPAEEDINIDDIPF